ncbi:MAG TPA: BON domain-containing protein [Verrucomicrobiae bacterium]|nr:BON domain-containing protein [Verrucomicrobiae bacterium]
MKTRICLSALAILAAGALVPAHAATVSKAESNSRTASSGATVQFVYHRAARPVFVVPSNVRVGVNTREDRYIADKILRQAVAEGAIRPNSRPLNLSVRNGRVHWSGRLDSSAQHRALISITRQTRGVRDINDELRK